MSRALALAAFSATFVQQHATALHVDTAAGKDYPVSKVVKLLNEMKSQLEKEQDADEDIFSKLACWCQTNDKAKTAAISTAEAKVARLGNTIGKMSAMSATLSQGIAGLTKEIETNQQSLEKATALRARQLAEFNEEEKAFIQSISALKNAVIVLSKHHDASAASLLSDKSIVKAFAIAKAHMDQHASLLQGSITPSQKRIVTALAQENGPTYAAYKPASGQIFGILKQMQETFESNLAMSQKEETASAEAFAELKVAKEEEIEAGQVSLRQKQQELAKTDQTVAQAQEDKEDTEASLAADKDFLADLKVKCSQSDADWEARQKDRQVEVTAVAKAISVLSSDDARDQFSKSFNPSLLQTKAQSNRQQAVEVLSKVASKSAQMAALVVNVKLDPFPKVKKAIDKMIAGLQKESEEEVAHKKYCVDELHTNTKQHQKLSHTKTNLESKITDLAQTIMETKATIGTVGAEIADLKVQKTRAAEDRAAEEKDFNGVVADQIETQRLLDKALGALQDVYGSDGVVLVQVNQQQKQEPPAGFSDYKKNTGSLGVIALIKQIIADAKEMEAEARHDEATSVKNYNEFVKTADESLKAKGSALDDLRDLKGKTDKKETNAKSELGGTMIDLEDQAGDAGALHKECDYTLDNFQVRQDARDEEVDALRKAKSFLSGMQ